MIFSQMPHCPNHQPLYHPSHEYSGRYTHTSHIHVYTHKHTPRLLKLGTDQSNWYPKSINLVTFRIMTWELIIRVHWVQLAHSALGVWSQIVDLVLYFQRNREFYSNYLCKMGEGCFINKKTSVDISAIYFFIYIFIDKKFNANLSKFAQAQPLKSYFFQLYGDILTYNLV